jgi:ribosomal-protein-alanine N-acetyltransferase
MGCPRSSVRVLAILPEIETPRLALRRFVYEDAPFVVELLNQPSFIRNIGDRGVRNVADAHRYLREGPMAMYGQYGFGLWHAARRADGVPVGTCGLLKRDILPDVDIGYAYLPEHWRQGYALEAARATLEYGARKFGLKRFIGVVSDHNTASIRVLEKLGMRFERMYPMHPGEPDVRLYGLELPPASGA